MLLDSDVPLPCEAEPLVPVRAELAAHGRALVEVWTEQERQGQRLSAADRQLVARVREHADRTSADSGVRAVIALVQLAELVQDLAQLTRRLGGSPGFTGLPDDGCRSRR
ncbi:hypothetical protein ACWF94_00120 [Streptomyces sp. NPDC055078]